MTVDILRLLNDVDTLLWELVDGTQPTQRFIDAVRNDLQKAIAEYPEDDDEPVTEKWLRELPGANDALIFFAGTGECPAVSFEFADDGGYRLFIGDSLIYDGLPSTRGDVRQLFKALRIELSQTRQLSEDDPYYEDDLDCPNCKAETKHKCRDSTHERDSSDDYRECLTCGWYRLGMGGEYQPPTKSM